MFCVTPVKKNEVKILTLNCITLFTNETIEYSYLEVQFAWEIIMADQRLYSSSVCRRVHKIAKIDCKLRQVRLSIRLSVCLIEQLSSHVWIIGKFDISGFFEKHPFFYPTVTRIVHKLINRLSTSRTFTITPMVIRGAKIFHLFYRVIRICTTAVWSLL